MLWLCSMPRKNHPQGNLRFLGFLHRMTEDLGGPCPTLVPTGHRDLSMEPEHLQGWSSGQPLKSFFLCLDGFPDIPVIFGTKKSLCSLHHFPLPGKDWRKGPVVALGWWSSVLYFSFSLKKLFVHARNWIGPFMDRVTQ